MSGIALQKMTLGEAQSWKSAVAGTANQLRILLFEGYERGAWEALGYANWTDCVKSLAEEHGFTERRLWQLHAANQTEKLLNPGSVGQIAEKVLRPLTQLEPDEQLIVWQRSLDTAPNGKVTAAHVEETVHRAKSSELPIGATRIMVEPRPAASPLPAEPVRQPMAIHYSSATPEHFTPQEIKAAVIAVMGRIDLDPCSNSKVTPNIPALTHYTIDDDGLAQAWFGRVYLNPPYGREIGEWVTRLVTEYEQGNVTEAIALVPSRTDTQWFRKLRNYPCCFVTGRLTFIGNEDAAPFPSAVFYLGGNDSMFRQVFSTFGDIWVRVEKE